MEKITNYKFKDFCKLKDLEKVESYLNLLELLNPVYEVTDPRKWIGKPKKIQLKNIKELTFGEVTTIKNNLANPSIESMIQMIMLVTGLEEKDCYNLTILDFYGTLAAITAQIIELANMEANELQNDDFDINLEAINANERMARFGVLNIINSLASDDVTKWQIIEDMPYMVVFTKLRMDKEKLAIQRELNELQRKKMNN